MDGAVSVCWVNVGAVVLSESIYSIKAALLNFSLKSILYGQNNIFLNENKSIIKICFLKKERQLIHTANYLLVLPPGLKGKNILLKL